MQVINAKTNKAVEERHPVWIINGVEIAGKVENGEIVEYQEGKAAERHKLTDAKPKISEVGATIVTSTKAIQGETLTELKTSLDNEILRLSDLVGKRKKIGKGAVESDIVTEAIIRYSGIRPDITAAQATRIDQLVKETRKKLDDACE